MNINGNGLDALSTLAAGVLFTSIAVSASDTWQMHEVEDGYSVAIAMRQDSAVAVPDENPANEVTPQLEFRCTPGSNDIIARIDWHRFISSFSTEAGFKVDDGRFTWLKWKVDSSESVTISPNGGDSQKLIEMISSGSTLHVEITPYSASPITAEYDISGFAAALDALRGKCE